MTTELLREAYATELVEAMDLKELCQFAYEKILENLENMPESELLEAIKENSSHLID
jgi:hypothetical protein